MTSDYEPVRVHVVADATRTAAGRPRRVSAIYRTITLTSTSPVANVAGTEPERQELITHAISNDVYLCASQADADAVALAGTGGGADNAYILPHADTAPTPYPVTEQVWAAAIAYPATLTVIIISREPR